MGTRLIPFERHRVAIRWQFVRGVMIGMLVSAAVGIPAFKYSKMRPEGVASLKASGQTTPRKTDTRAASQAPGETADKASPAAFQPKPPATRPPNQVAGNRLEPAVAGVGAKSSAFPLSKPTPLAEASFTKSTPTKNTLTRLAQLWALVEMGDTKAAVDLADIYLRGEGVPANCEQARVLLFVASKENNAEATKRLQDLDANGCPTP